MGRGQGGGRASGMLVRPTATRRARAAVFQTAPATPGTARSERPNSVTAMGSRPDQTGERRRRPNEQPEGIHNATEHTLSKRSETRVDKLIEFAFTVSPRRSIRCLLMSFARRPVDSSRVPCSLVFFCQAHHGSLRPSFSSPSFRLLARVLSSAVRDVLVGVEGACALAVA